MRLTFPSFCIIARQIWLGLLKITAEPTLRQLQRVLFGETCRWIECIQRDRRDLTQLSFGPALTDYMKHRQTFQAVLA